jgi:hypothetical protein
MRACGAPDAMVLRMAFNAKCNRELHERRFPTLATGN